MSLLLLYFFEFYRQHLLSVSLFCGISLLPFPLHSHLISILSPPHASSRNSSELTPAPDTDAGSPSGEALGTPWVA